MGRIYCCECGADCYHGDLFFECAQCEDTCQECAESSWERCEYCGDLQCPNCLDAGNEACKSWPTEEETLDELGRETDAYVVIYDCCGEQPYDGEIDGLQLYDTVCPSCYFSLDYEISENLKKARKEHHATRFWCTVYEEYGCESELCQCKEKVTENHIMKWRMKKEGDTKTVDGKTWYWCPTERREGVYDGLYMPEREITTDEAEKHEEGSTNEGGAEETKEEESTIQEENQEEVSATETEEVNRESVENITTMMAAVRTEEEAVSTEEEAPTTGSNWPFDEEGQERGGRTDQSSIVYYECAQN